MKINQAGLDLIKSCEGLALNAYQDQGGVWTIGYGHTGPEVVKGMVMTEQQALQTLQKDISIKAEPIDNWVTRELTQNQFAALCSLCYNVGISAVRKSVTLQLVNADKDPTAEWLGFSYIEGVENEGLLNRRKKELELYFTSDEET